MDHIPAEVKRHILSQLSHSGVRNIRSILISVCSTWRNIINTTPEFWRTVYLRDVSVNGTPIGQNHLIWEDLAKRADSLSINVVWCVSHTAMDENAQSFRHLEQALDQFLRTAPTSRWRSLRIDGLSPLPPAIIKGGTFENLESFEVAQYCANIALVLENIHAKAEKLDALSIFASGPLPDIYHTPDLVAKIMGQVSKFGCGVTPLGIRMVGRCIDRLRNSALHNPNNNYDTNKLTHVKMQTFHVQDFCGLHLPNLTSLEIGESTPERSTHPITLPNLRRLVFAGIDYHFLRSLHAPLLESLEFRLDSAGPSTAADEDEAVGRNDIPLLNTIFADQYNLSPSVLILARPLSLMTITAAIFASRRVEHLTIFISQGISASLFSDIMSRPLPAEVYETDEDGQSTQDRRSIVMKIMKDANKFNALDAPSMSEEGNASQSVHPESAFPTRKLCPDLISLRLLFNDGVADQGSERDVWKECASKILKGRGNSPTTSVTCTWSDGSSVVI